MKAWALEDYVPAWEHCDDSIHLIYLISPFPPDSFGLITCSTAGGRPDLGALRLSTFRPPSSSHLVSPSQSLSQPLWTNSQLIQSVQSVRSFQSVPSVHSVQSVQSFQSVQSEISFHFKVWDILDTTVIPILQAYLAHHWFNFEVYFLQMDWQQLATRALRCYSSHLRAWLKQWRFPSHWHRSKFQLWEISTTQTTQ